MPAAATALSLSLPAALLRSWPATEADRTALERAEALWSRSGLVRLDTSLFALLPDARRPAVFESAVQIATSILAGMRQRTADSEPPGFLIFPGRVRLDGEHLELEDEELLADLSARPPRMPAASVMVTSHAASWLRGRYRLEAAGHYQGPSGRRVPLCRVAGAESEPRPWHNVEILGRGVHVERPHLAAAIAEALERTTAWVEGPLGVGKSRAVWAALEGRGEARSWIVLGRSLPGIARLSRCLVAELQRLAPGTMPAEARSELARPESAEPERAATVLASWLVAAHRHLGRRLRLVIDDFQAATPLDRAFLAELLGRADATAWRTVLIGRERSALGFAVPAGAAEVEVPAMTEAELELCCDRLFQGLEVAAEVRRRFLEASAGFPFPLEEGVVELVHRRLIRRVYGSFFFDGRSDTAYEPSQRVVRHVESELRGYGEPLPLRLLAAADQALPAGHLELAAVRLGLELGAGWERSLLASRWLETEESPWGAALTFTCPAYGMALAKTLTPEASTILRRAVGLVISEDVPDALKAWRAYGLLEGGPDALAPLLQATRGAGGGVDREEVFDALLREHRRLHQLGQPDATLELDLLWTLLPLGHRLHRLSELEAELERGVGLASEDPARYVALATLKAELDQERGRFPDAERGLRRALEISEGGDPRRRALLFVRLGRLLLRQDRLAEAREVFEPLLEVVDRDSPTSLGATCRFYLGNVALRERRFEVAEEMHRQAFELRRRQQLWQPMGASLSALGAVAIAIGDYPKALERYREAEQALVEHGEEAEVSFALVGQGRALGFLGDHAAASRPLKRAFELRHGGDDLAGEAIAGLELAANQLALGHFEEALGSAREAAFRLQMMPESEQGAQAEQLLGRILFSLRQWDEAAGHLGEALRIHRRSGDASAIAADLSWLIELALRRERENAVLERCRELREILAELPYPALGEMLHFRLYRGLDWLRRRGHAVSDPLEPLRRAFEELMRKTGFLDAELRNTYLFNVREHQELIDVAAEHQLEIPEH